MFYKDLQYAIGQNKFKTSIITGYWHAKEGEDGIRNVIGKYVMGERNYRVERLKVFDEANNFYINDLILHEKMTEDGLREA